MTFQTYAKTSLATPPRLPVTTFPDYPALCERVASVIEALVRDKPDAVLGLATGSSAIGVYESLIRRHRQEGLDFSRVTCFNLDEYYPMPAHSPQSYHTFMREHLFDQINCRHWHVPDGRPRSDQEVDDDCARYEEAITAAGGVDLQLLGIGRSGHIGFNEPGSLPESRTRRVTLHPFTLEDAAPGFGGLENVPQQAITMGVATILEARQIMLIASGHQKAEIIRIALTGAITPAVPASLLRGHGNAHIFLAEMAVEQG